MRFAPSSGCISACYESSQLHIQALLGTVLNPLKASVDCSSVDFSARRMHSTFQMVEFSRVRWSRSVGSHRTQLPIVQHGLRFSFLISSNSFPSVAQSCTAQDHPKSSLCSADQGSLGSPVRPEPDAPYCSELQSRERSPTNLQHSS